MIRAAILGASGYVGGELMRLLAAHPGIEVGQAFGASAAGKSVSELHPHLGLAYGDQAIFSELSPRPHDTGMVTLISQSLSEFELHLRAILGLPIPAIDFYGPSASAVILADRESDDFRIEGLSDALSLGKQAAPVDVRIFGKPNTLKNRRMGVALARAKTVDEATALAVAAAGQVSIRYS